MNRLLYACGVSILESEWLEGCGELPAIRSKHAMFESSKVTSPHLLKLLFLKTIDLKMNALF